MVQLGRRDQRVARNNGIGAYCISAGLCSACGAEDPLYLLLVSLTASQGLRLASSHWFEKSIPAGACVRHFLIKLLDVCGFFFRDIPDFEPDKQLRQFLAAGPPPVYIGFGSIVIDEPSTLTSIIVNAATTTGVRAVVSRGWSKLGLIDGREIKSDKIFLLDDCPHEWLFQQVAVVVHHGGAGTTACGLRFGVPTTVVPFFGE